MRPRVSFFAFSVILFFAGCEKEPGEEDKPPPPTPKPRVVAGPTPIPHVTPWAPIAKSKGPDATWLYRQPTPVATPTPTPKPFHSSLGGSSLNGSSPANPQSNSTPKKFHSALDDPPQSGGGAGRKR